MRSTFKVLFYAKRTAVKSDGTLPIMGRITVNGTIAQFSCKLNIRTSLWDAKSYRVSGKSLESQRINARLDNIKSQIHKQYQHICDHDAYVTAEKVKNAYLGFGSEYKKVLELLDEHLSDLKKRIGRDRAQNTYDNCSYYRNYIAEFISYKYRVSDMPIRELEFKFIEEFCVYLKCTRNMRPGTIVGAVIRLKWVTHTAHANGWISVDPFCQFKYHPQYRERRFLTDEELTTLINTPLNNAAQNRIRDIFLFCTFTGLSYIDVRNLVYSDLKERNGELWIIKNRQKTQTQFAVRLLPVARQLADKYRGMTDGIHVFTVNDRRSMNISLKRISQKCSFDFTLSTHMGRHTFATTVTLTQGVPLETVSKMLGHKQITTTQIYAKITQEKIGRELDRLEEKISDKYKLVL